VLFAIVAAFATPRSSRPYKQISPCYLSSQVVEGGIMLSTRAIPRAHFHFKALLLLAAAFLLIAAAPTSAQKNKKDKNAAPPQSPLTPVPENHVIDVAISEMLGAWQLGDADRMHKYYADDVLVVSGAWEPPIFSWANYLPAYKSQRARMGPVSFDRTNTAIKVKDNTAWATYQWEFGGIVDGNKITARGNTTLAFEKRDGVWLIVLNHTSVTPEAAAAPAAKPNL
jgi:ketosteroid isomerase-like protein